MICQIHTEKAKGIVSVLVVTKGGESDKDGRWPTTSGSANPGLPVSVDGNSDRQHPVGHLIEQKNSFLSISLYF
jgi:hypothetical protein